MQAPSDTLTVGMASRKRPLRDAPIHTSLSCPSPLLPIKIATWSSSWMNLDGLLSFLCREYPPAQRNGMLGPVGEVARVPVEEISVPRIHGFLVQNNNTNHNVGQVSPPCFPSREATESIRICAGRKGHSIPSKYMELEESDADAVSAFAQIELLQRHWKSRIWAIPKSRGLPG